MSVRGEDFVTGKEILEGKKKKEEGTLEFVERILHQVLFYLQGAKECMENIDALRDSFIEAIKARNQKERGDAVEDFFRIFQELRNAEWSVDCALRRVEGLLKTTLGGDLNEKDKRTH